MSEPVFALELRQLRKQLGASEIIRSVDLQLRAGERVALIGPNGAGKSTLFNLISGRLAPSSGAVLLHGRPIQGLRPFAIYRLGLARSFQVSSLFPQLSAFENIRCALLWRRGLRYAFWRFLSDRSPASVQADALLQRLGLAAQRNTAAAALSYAQARALELGMTLAGGASVILLDEPTAGMSQSETAAFVALIRELTVGKTLLIVEHDMGVVFELADRVAVLAQGELIAFDTPQAVRAHPLVQQAYLGTELGTALGAAPGVER